MQRTADADVEVNPNGPGAVPPLQVPGNGAALHADELVGEQGLDLHTLLDALDAVSVGDFSVRLPGSRAGVAGKVADRFNQIVAANQRMAQELEQVGQVVGRDGETRKRVRFGLTHGAWGDMEESVNTLIDDLLWPTT